MILMNLFNFEFKLSVIWDVSLESYVQYVYCCTQDVDDVPNVLRQQRCRPRKGCIHQGLQYATCLGEVHGVYHVCDLNIKMCVHLHICISKVGYLLFTFVSTYNTA